MKIFIRLAAGLLAAAVGFGQTIVENPDKPSNPAAGRTVKLLELMRIRDDGEKIVFKNPYQLQIGDDGSIYFGNLGEFYKFDAQGRFVYKVVKRGQGPGEAVGGTQSLLTKEGMIIQSSSPPKVMRFDPQGKYLGEDRTTITNTFEFVAMVDGKIYAFLEENPPWGKIAGPDYFNVPISFCILSPDLKTIEKPFQFTYRWYLGQSYGWQMARFDYAFKDPETVYVVHGIDYRIDHFNIKRNAVEKTITRKFAHVKRPPEKRNPRPNVLQAPFEEFYYDISKVLLAGDNLWVVTSVRNERQSRLIDVFNARGKYIDNFYLDFPPGFTPVGLLLGTVVLKNGFLYSADENAEGFFSIAKYEILDPEKRDRD